MASIEKTFTGIVWCSDILAIAARAVVVLVIDFIPLILLRMLLFERSEYSMTNCSVLSVPAGGPPFNVDLGRHDGLVSNASLVPAMLPQPTFNVAQLVPLFAKNNLNQVDTIALSGTYTIGFSHCTRFANRLSSFSANFPVDPSLNSTYAVQLKLECPPNVDPRIAVNMDPVTQHAFDNQYYKNLVNMMGMFTFDQDLSTNSVMNPKVTDFANNARDFETTFAAAMRKLGRVNIKIGSQRQTRKDGTAFNSLQIKG